MTNPAVGASADRSHALGLGPRIASTGRPERVCFTLRVRPDRLAVYRELHAAVWPEMLREIAASGRHNYSIFLTDDGLLIGYFETDDLQASAAYLADSEVAARWEAEMAPFFEALDGRPDQDFTRIPEIFNLGDQLAAAATAPEKGENR